MHRMAGNTPLTHLTFLLDCIISPIEHRSHVIHKLHVSLMEAVWYLSSFCVFAVIWSYDLWQEQREPTCRLGQLRYKNVHTNEQHKWNQICPTGKNLLEVCICQPGACLFPQLKAERFLWGPTWPKLLWMYRAQVVQTCTSMEENPAGQHMLGKHLNNHFLEQSSTWVSPSAFFFFNSFGLGNGGLFKQCLDVSLKNHCQECL